MLPITDIDELEALYGAAVPAALTKVAHRVTPLYRQWIDASRFLILSTVGPEGTDASPRGDDGPVVRIADAETLLLPDWRGNNRIDSLRNIVRDGRVSLLFMVPGCNNVVRVNGHAMLTADDTVTGLFEKAGQAPEDRHRDDGRRDLFPMRKSVDAFGALDVRRRKHRYPVGRTIRSGKGCRFRRRDL